MRGRPSAPTPETEASGIRMILGIRAFIIAVTSVAYALGIAYGSRTTMLIAAVILAEELYETGWCCGSFATTAQSALVMARVPGTAFSRLVRGFAGGPARRAGRDTRRGDRA
jgi:hypothetical protein